MGRAYLYWTPYKWVALKAAYEYEDFERDREASFGAKEVTTNKFPLGINLYHPSGLSAVVKATFYDQDGEFLPQGEAPLPENFIDGDDQFWLFDAAISYRLPKRYGFVTVGARNLFDKEFKYYDTDPNNPAIIPDRMFFVRITLSI
jgi:hypothetical protein